MIDYIIAIILITSIIYLWHLNRKVTHFLNMKQELTLLMHSFNKSIGKAETTIAELKKLSGKTSIDIQTKIDKANYLTNDLSFMSDRATELAEKLEKIIEISKNTNERMYFQQRRFLARKDIDFKAGMGNSKQELQMSLGQNTKESMDKILNKLNQINQLNSLAKSSDRKEMYKPIISNQEEYYKNLRKVKV